MLKFQSSRFLLALIISLPILTLIGCAGAGSGPESINAIVISGSDPRGISTSFYGQNYFCWMSSLQDTVHGTEDQVRTLKLNVLRVGGCNNDSQTGVGPEPFTAEQVDEYIAYCRSVGAEPIFQVSLLKNVAGERATAQDAADWVTYCNITKNYDVKYWEIGNEPDCYEEKEHIAYSVDDFCDDFISFSQAMKAVDPTIKILGPELGWKYHPRASGSDDWLTPFLRKCRGAFDIVAVHRYPFTANQCSISGALNDRDDFRTVIRGIRELMESQGCGNIPLAFTEANITWDGEPSHSTMPASPQTFFAGLWVADSLGVALEENLWSMAYWNLCEGWKLGFLDSVTKQPTPSFYAMQMYSTHFGKKMLHTRSVPNGFSVYVSRNNADDRSILMVINKNSVNRRSTIRFQDFSSPLIDLSYDFPAYSMTCMSIPDDGGAAQIWRYTKVEADKNLPPEGVQ